MDRFYIENKFQIPSLRPLRQNINGFSKRIVVINKVDYLFYLQGLFNWTSREKLYEHKLCLNLFTDPCAQSKEIMEQHTKLILVERIYNKVHYSHLSFMELPEERSHGGGFLCYCQVSSKNDRHLICPTQGCFMNLYDETVRVKKNCGHHN